MGDLTYNLPDEKKFFYAIQQMLLRSSKQREIEIGEKIKGAKCTIATSN